MNKVVRLSSDIFFIALVITFEAAFPINDSFSLFVSLILDDEID